MSVLRMVGMIILDKILTSSINALSPKETIREVGGHCAMSNITRAVTCNLTIRGRRQEGRQ